MTPILTSLALLVAADPYVVWNNPPRAPQPLLRHETYHSAAMDTDVGYNVYLPPGYAEDRARYPVIYWLHGRNCNESTDQFPARIVDEGIRSGELRPVILVYASGGGKTYYADSPDGKVRAETTVLRELIPTIDRRYRTIARREGRAISGMSMGGFGAMKLALKHPDLFSSVVAFAGGYRPGEVLAHDQPDIWQRMWNADASRFDADTPFAWARRNAARVRGRLGIKMVVGTGDFLLADNRRLHALLDELKIPHAYEEVDGVKHDLPRLSAHVGARGVAFRAGAIRGRGDHAARAADASTSFFSSRSTSTGLIRCPSKPASRARCRSSGRP